MVPLALLVCRLIALAFLVLYHEMLPGVTSPAALSIPKCSPCPGSPVGGLQSLACTAGDLVALSTMSPLGHWYGPM